MAKGKRALIFGVHSFVDNPLKVGIQYIAEGLAASGWQVDYVSIFSSPLDVIGHRRHCRLRRVWQHRQDVRGITVKPGLTEFAFRAPFPAHRRLLRFDWQLWLFDLLRPDWLKRQQYDLCIHDVTANIVYLPQVMAKLKVLRLNDLPEGFRHSLSGKIIERISQSIKSGNYQDIWTAHSPLTDYVLAMNPCNRVITIANGVDDEFLRMETVGFRKPESAVYVGSIEKWIDLSLIEKTARILPNWRFDIIGPLNQPWTIRSSNVRWLPPIPRSNVIATLNRYQVGLIPFREVSGRLAYVEKPLKFYEYICGGIGVACTDVGSLKAGMGDWASYGNTPEAFAGAITREASRVSQRSKAERLNFVKPFVWSSIIKKMQTRLEDLGIDDLDMSK